MNKTRSKTTRMLCESGVMIALAFALSYVKISMPFGGSVTPASMLPICLVAVKYGPRWGTLTAFVYSWLQVFQSSVFGWGLTPAVLVGCLLLDYVVAFTLLGLSGMLAKRGRAGIVGGIAIACVLRFLCHFVSGIILWTNLEEFVVFGVEFVDHPILYSLVYNGSFMLPETVILVAVAAVVYRVSALQKILY